MLTITFSPTSWFICGSGQPKKNPMIIYWETLEKNAGDSKTIPEYISSAYFPYARRALTLFGKAICRVFMSSEQVDLASSVYHKVLFDDFNFNPGGYFDLVNSQFNVHETGFYLILASILPALRLAGLGANLVVKNNSNIVSKRNVRSVDDNVFSISLDDIFYFEAGDVISLWYYFYDPGNLSSISGGSESTFFSIFQLGSE